MIFSEFHRRAIVVFLRLSRNIGGVLWSAVLGISVHLPFPAMGITMTLRVSSNKHIASAQMAVADACFRKTVS